jgi:uncharacterized protein with GYD domain
LSLASNQDLGILTTEETMPRYLIEASYTLEGVKGLTKEGGSKRREAASAAIQGLGGKVESFYFAFGDPDAIVIADLPDNASAAAASLAINASGAVNVKTRVLLTTEEIDSAVKKTVNYRAPGR